MGGEGVIALRAVQKLLEILKSLFGEWLMGL